MPLYGIFIRSTKLKLMMIILLDSILYKNIIRLKEKISVNLMKLQFSAKNNTLPD